ncbi:hypothetical protein [Sinanaerobacter chloroacetimidivorans]|uniref:Acetylglutamate kinase n=1 Tax=Sinanaerobacter chloroacetimidivorans TaxID=2818044 RepID=A0A8J7W073_9FIRM|nr:hypothetical protein [Sinanaerobacter chloroacetimidivorans]MBR0597193.1 hypothetical protein [Sinanaerobacter chloroacetimidivorans]
MVDKKQDESNYITYGQMNLINDFRTLWAELTIWERSYIASIAAQFGNDMAVSDRLHRIPSDFKSKLETFYGEVAPERFEFLLTKHITLIQEMVKAQQRGDIEAMNTAITELYKNSDEISTYLAMMNPYWNAAQWRILLDQYLRLTIDQIVALFSGDFSRDIEIYDRLAHHALILGDYMAAGVMQYLITKEAQKRSPY